MLIVWPAVKTLVLLDDGISCEAIAKVLLLDDDTIRTWHRLYEEDGIEGLTNLATEEKLLSSGRS
ncbi:MAG: helix-turn-helix domain-containing protein [Xanthobacteraceae bacterium]|nr:helix-turn-helix domain-containing protein [Xanthobacteraceae bacterium]